VTWLEPFTRHLAAGGLNLVGCLDVEVARACHRGPAPLPPQGSVLLCGSGGTAHWPHVTAADRATPHPIENAARRAISAALALATDPATLLDAGATLGFDLRALAVHVGWGMLSPYLLMVVHPVYGPWLSIRALVVTTAVLPRSVPLQGFDPCGPCARPCLDACPAGAYRRSATWSFHACAEHRGREREVAQPCDVHCRSRSACVVGTAHAYGPEEQRHRHRASLPDVRAFLARGR
jgi:epoxyqueuosine reductase